jgi:hypothetical protein
MRIPEKIRDAVGLVAEVGAVQVVRKRMADNDSIRELSELDVPDSDARWVMYNDDDLEGEWSAGFCYDPSKPLTTDIISKVRDYVENYYYGRQRAAALGIWVVHMICDYKRFWVHVTAPDTTGVTYLFSIRNEEVVILRDTLKSAELNAMCEKYVERAQRGYVRQQPGTAKRPRTHVSQTLN